VSIFRSDAALAILQVLNPLRSDGLWNPVSCFHL